eukprot:CAMPEP_0177770756 /NCGR_PEP_ID=MMETSP0491_2-20121128/11131_1 /TAXON_ID=63592 /ORGANISM="Tetraselmis chuii, Strain PLY429" /LENGTH=71 /DNA_ID=CAMNT_0019288065 /DNA_START=143 /DNA_END=358 /DNA_ORIENTATION=-
MAPFQGGGGRLEAFKFVCYISIPIIMTMAVAGVPGNLESIIRNRSYVVYPPSGPAPPTLEEVQEMNKKQAK